MDKQYGVAINLNGQEIRNYRIQVLGAAPSGMGVGDVGRQYFNSAKGNIEIWDGTAWVDYSQLLNNLTKTQNAITLTRTGRSIALSISTASASDAGFMSASDFSKLAASTPSNSAHTLVQRDGNGDASFGTVSATQMLVTNAPTLANQVATKAYVDAISVGLQFKASVRVATTININLSGTQIVDGISLAIGNRVLVKNQTSSSQNGIFVVQSGAWTRASDFAIAMSARGAFVFVEQGNTHADTGWVCSNDNGNDVIGTNDIAFAMFTKGTDIIPGTGLEALGNTWSVVGYVPVSGATVTRKRPMTGTIGLSAGTVTFTHNLNTTAIAVTVIRSNNEQLEVAWVSNNVNSCQILSNLANETVTVVIMG